MGTVKTAISIEESFLGKIDALSHRLKISRSEFFCFAAKRLVDIQENAKFLQAINDAHDEASASKEEKKWLKQVKNYHMKILKREKW